MPDVRAEGPAVVTGGDPAGPTLIVLDPAGVGKHHELPATWRPFTEDRQVFWCRLPTEGALAEADEVLGDAGPGEPAIDVLASGPFAEEALRLAERHPGAARRVLLVDPSAHALREPRDAVADDDAWATEHRDQFVALRNAGTQVRIIAHSTGGKSDRVPPPLPLGHPDVVAAVTRVLGEV